MAPETVALPTYHRGDPLDIPLIDQHLVHMLSPRITSAIRYAFPELYLDWTTGVSADESTSRSAPFIRKRWVEMLLHMSVLLGSCQVRRRGGNSGSNNNEMNIYLATPAMKNLGMILQSTSNSNQQPRSSKIKVYAKIVALVLATAVIPALYEELKLRRQRQLERQETRLRITQLHEEFQTTPSTASRQPSLSPNQEQQNERSLIQQRAQKRKTRIQRLLVDSILGMSDILMPPLRLITYVSYLWGLCPTPNVGSSMIGMEYASVNDIHYSDSASQSILAPSQRHVNFQYGNRRLMVEEGLRTMATILPPRSNSHAQDAFVDRPSRNDDATVTTQVTQRRRGWIRQRALSFMGVVEEADEAETQNTHDTHCALNCALCRSVPAMIPYITSCGHCYCYICLRMAVTEDPYYRCVICRKRIDTSSRLTFKSPPT